MTPVNTPAAWERFVLAITAFGIGALLGRALELAVERALLWHPRVRWWR